LAVETVLRDGIEGDCIETGVWRGGACIYMCALLAVYGVTDRRMWAADSFEGLPAPSPELYPVDNGDLLHTIKALAVGEDEVRSNFAKYNLLDDQVLFLKGWFKDTLPKAPIEKLAILRLDGDLYESTIQALDALYDKVSDGGFIIVDDYALPTCSSAIHDFMAKREITSPLVAIDTMARFWRKGT